MMEPTITFVEIVVGVLSVFLLVYFRHEIFRFMWDHPVPFFPIVTIYMAFNVVFIYVSKWFAVGLFAVYFSIPYISTLPDSEQLLFMSRMNTSITTMMENGLDTRLVWMINIGWDCYLWVTFVMVFVIIVWYIIHRKYQ
jgi:hypothetical protein